MEKDYSYLKEVCDHQAEQLSRTSLKLQEKASESDAEIKDMKDTIFELEDQVEQHRAVKLHNNQLISELESKWSQAWRSAVVWVDAVRVGDRWEEFLRTWVLARVLESPLSSTLWSLQRAALLRQAVISEIK